jgi:hypothetical protein
MQLSDTTLARTCLCVAQRFLRCDYDARSKISRQSTLGIAPHSSRSEYPIATCRVLRQLTRITICDTAMFKGDRYLRRRVHITQTAGRLSVRIERQNARGVYIWLTCLFSVGFGLFCSTIWDATLQNPNDALYVLPVFALGLACYALVLAIAVWGIFGVEEILVEGNALIWTRRALTWSRVRSIPVDDITRIKAITPWYGMDNAVEVTAVSQSYSIGNKLLRDEALELAQNLHDATHSNR